MRLEGGCSLLPAGTCPWHAWPPMPHLMCPPHSASCLSSSPLPFVFPPPCSHPPPPSLCWQLQVREAKAEVQRWQSVFVERGLVRAGAGERTV